MQAQRIEPLAAPEWVPALGRVLDVPSIAGARPAHLNLFRTLAHHPSLLRRYMAFGDELLNRGLLDDRLRELVILRTAHNCACDYEWTQHVRIALGIGMSHAEIDRVACSPLAGWEEPDRAVLVAADELCRSAGLSDATWDALAAELDEAELIEVLMLVGQYRLLAGVLNSLRIAVDPEVEAYARRSGSKP